MRVIVFISIFAINALFLVSCNKDDKIETPNSGEYPVAAFSFTGNEGPAPVTVYFTNYSEVINPDSCEYTWTFGENGPQSHDENPSFTFYNNGTQTINYPVNLLVHDLISDKSQARTILVPVEPAQ